MKCKSELRASPTEEALEHVVVVLAQAPFEFFFGITGLKLGEQLLKYWDLETTPRC